MYVAIHTTWLAMRSYVYNLCGTAQFKLNALAHCNYKESHTFHMCTARNMRFLVMYTQTEIARM